MSALVLPMGVSLTGVASRHILESRALCQLCHALPCYVSGFLWVVKRRWSLTEVKVKTRIQPKEPTRFEDVAYSGGSTRRFDQLDSLLLRYRVFQLPPNLQTSVSS